MSHAQKAAPFVANSERAQWHDESLWFVRQKRDRVRTTIEEWESLREKGSIIKQHTLGRLSHYLQEFQEKAEENGIKVHWALDGEEHNRIVHQLLAAHGVQRIVKSKSMLTEECHLNPYLEAQGIEVVDTDLGERIVQFAEQPPSHIVMPAIHFKKEEIGELFHEKLHTEKGATDPKYLTEAARQHLRDHFLKADAAITGVNFAVAETGGFVVCTNEGNADMGVHLASLHIACMGIEKIIPRQQDLGVFLRLLARSATGQHITTYTSHFLKPREGAELHVVLVDNGRSRHLARPDFRSALKCIRCGACLNTCPIYRRSGGHSYESTIPGPIGAVLMPGMDLERHKSLPFASTLCGSCTDVCPVKIDLHTQLYKWRQVITEEGLADRSKSSMMKWTARVMAKNTRFSRAGKWMRRVMRVLPSRLLYHRLNIWGRNRDLPDPPAQSFSEWYKKNREGHGKSKENT